MKKLLSLAIALVMVCGLAVIFASCGDKVTFPMDYTKYDMTKYVKLGDYKNLSIDIVTPDFTDEDYEYAIEQLLEQYSDYEHITNRYTASGDTIVANYKGYIDGVLDENLGNESSEIELAETSGFNAVHEFTNSLIGKLPGNTIEFDSYFEDQETYSEYKDKTIHFVVELLYIKGTEKVSATLDNAFVYELTGGEYNTVEAFNDYYKNYLIDYQKDYSDTQKYDTMWEQIIDNATFIEVPQGQVDYYYNKYASYAQQLKDYYDYQGYSYTLGDILDANFGVTSLEKLESLCVYYVKQELCIFAIIQQESLTVTDEEYTSYYANYEEQYGADAVESVVSEYGDNYMYTTFLSEKLSKQLMESLKITYHSLKDELNTTEE